MTSTTMLNGDAEVIIAILVTAAMMRARRVRSVVWYGDRALKGLKAFIVLALMSSFASPLAFRAHTIPAGVTSSTSTPLPGTSGGTPRARRSHTNSADLRITKSKYGLTRVWWPGAPRIMPPGRTTRTISSIALRGSEVQWSMNCENTASKLPSAIGQVEYIAFLEYRTVGFRDSGVPRRKPVENALEVIPGQADHLGHTVDGRDPNVALE